MRRTALAILYVTVFVDLVGFGIVLPLLPFYAQRYGAAGLGVGALMAAYSALQFLGAPLLGRLSDRHGRRPVLLVALAGSAISLAVSAFADSLLVLIIARGLAGLFGGSIATAHAYIADVTLPKDRARYMGLLGAAIGLGFVFGPALGAGLSRFGFGTAALVASAVAAANLGFAWRWLEEPRGTRVRRREALSLARLATAARSPAVLPVVASTFLATAAFVAMESTFALLGERHFGLTAERLGLVFTFIGVVIVAVQGGLVGRMAKALGERTTALLGAASMGLGLGVLPLVHTLPQAMAILGVMAAGQALVTPSLSALLSQAASAEHQGGILGLGQSAAALARAVGPLVAGWLFDLRAPLPYFVGAALMLLTALLLASSRPALAAAPEPAPEPVD